MFSILKTVSVQPNQVGYLYKNNRFHKRLQPGLYRFWAGFTEFTTVLLPISERFVSVTNQEVLTKDNIALRFSYFVRYTVSDTDRFVAKFDVFKGEYALFFDAEQLIHHLSQVELRKAIAQVDSETLNEQRHQLLSTVPEQLQQQLLDYGILLQELTLRDLSFPKAIQDLFSRRLESKIRAQSDLENARTAVASARALKNASELMKGDENIRFLQLLETLTKVAATGKHTFVLGDLLPSQGKGSRVD
jgi:regulator of protease activity HflC (stomatin/prohibitin superfamily)